MLTILCAVAFLADSVYLLIVLIVEEGSYQDWPWAVLLLLVCVYPLLLLLTKRLAAVRSCACCSSNLRLTAKGQTRFSKEHFQYRFLRSFIEEALHPGQLQVLFRNQQLAGTLAHLIGREHNLWGRVNAQAVASQPL